jgi:hypothetical protein
MLTITGIVLETEKVREFLQRTRIKEFKFSGLKWELHHINVPLLSQREKLKLDQKYRTLRRRKSVADLASKWRRLSPSRMKCYATTSTFIAITRTSTVSSTRRFQVVGH